MDKLLPQNNIPKITLYCIDTREKKSIGKTKKLSEKLNIGISFKYLFNCRIVNSEDCIDLRYIEF